MTSSVSILPESTHIADLIPLMSNQGGIQLSITKIGLVGMVYQANLIAALYNESHDYDKNQPLLSSHYAPGTIIRKVTRNKSPLATVTLNARFISRLTRMINSVDINRDIKIA